MTIRVSLYQKKHSPTCTHEEEEEICTDNKVHCIGAHPL